MEFVFLLQHVAREDEDDEDVKTIGVFSSEDVASFAIDQLRNRPGFRDFPDSFVISRKLVDQVSWEEGFGV